MNNEEERIRAATQALLTDKFIQELGQKAIVQDVELNEGQKQYVAELRGVLSDSALDLQKVGIIDKGFDYLGSFSVHVYASELLRAFEFITINNPHKTTHPVADAAMRKLNQSVVKHFTGKDGQKLRSGF